MSVRKLDPQDHLETNSGSRLFRVSMFLYFIQPFKKTKQNRIVILLTLGYLCIFSFICASLRDLVISGASSNNFLKGTSGKETRRGYRETSCEIKSRPQESTGGKMSTKCFVLFPRLVCGRACGRACVGARFEARDELLWSA